MHVQIYIFHGKAISQVKLAEMYEKEIVEAYEELAKAHKQVQVLIRTVGCVADDLEYMLNKMKKEAE